MGWTLDGVCVVCAGTGDACVVAGDACGLELGAGMSGDCTGVAIVASISMGVVVTTGEEMPGLALTNGEGMLGLALGDGVATRRRLGGVSERMRGSLSLAAGSARAGDVVAEDDARNGKTDSSNTTWRDVMTRRVLRSRHR